jgi:hypothetical protein
MQDQRKTNNTYGREPDTVIQAKIDFTNNWIPFIMDAEAFVQLVNVMMMKKKEGNKVSAVEMEREVSLVNEEEQRTVNWGRLC